MVKLSCLFLLSVSPICGAGDRARDMRPDGTMLALVRLEPSDPTAFTVGCCGTYCGSHPLLRIASRQMNEGEARNSRE